MVEEFELKTVKGSPSPTTMTAVSRDPSALPARRFTESGKTRRSGETTVFQFQLLLIEQ